MYRLLQVLHFILYIPLFVYLSLFLMWIFRRFCVVLLTRYVMFSFVFLKMLVTFLIMGLWYSNVTHFLLLCCVCVLGVLLLFLFIICLFSLSIIEIGYPLCLTIWMMVFISWCFCFGDNGSWCNLFSKNIYADILCFSGWFDF
jgi:hypothetical protein